MTCEKKTKNKRKKDLERFIKKTDSLREKEVEE